MIKAQPKVSELVEILLQQVNNLQTSVDQNNKIQLYLSKKIDNTNIKVDISDLDQLQLNYSNKLNTDLNNCLNEFEKNSEKLLNTSKQFSSRKMGYLILLNIFLFIFSSVLLYIAMKNLISKSDYNHLKEENQMLESQIENVKHFFQENPKNAKWYKEWKKKNKK